MPYVSTICLYNVFAKVHFNITFVLFDLQYQHFSDVVTMSTKYTSLTYQMSANNISLVEQYIVMFNSFFCGNQSGDLAGQLLSAGGKSTQ